MLRRVAVVLLLGLATTLTQTAFAVAGAPEPDGPRVEVIVELSEPAVARLPAVARPRALRQVEGAQRALASRILAVSPSADLRWRYRLVLDGMAVVLPSSDVARIEALPGVRAIYPSVRYHAAATSRSAVPADGPAAIGAPAIWGPGLEHAGRGIKIGIIDDGIDQSHPYFDPSDFTMPEGFPKGAKSSTSAKVIVARSFAPAGAGWKYAGRPFDPVYSSHGTHVAGIAAGNPRTAVKSSGGARFISGVAPLAYLGNYKALTVPTESGVGLDGNSPELVAAIEAAVADGMDVINLSLGEPDVDPSRDVVAKALGGAAAAGVVPVVAAGNEYSDLGRGSVGSPGTSERAITVAATTDDGVIASFSSSGPAPLGLGGKPDVAAPGVDVLSAAPEGRFELLSGTSMASPNVAGAAALLRELHPEWSVAQLKSALVSTGGPVWTSPGRTDEVPSPRSGGGFVKLEAAAAPLLLASPQNLSFGYLDVSAGGSTSDRAVELADVGGAGTWNVSILQELSAPGVTISAPPAVTVPGTLAVTASAATGAPEGEHSGFLVLERDGTKRRLPFWFRVVRPQLPGERFTVLRRDGTYRGNTARGESRVSSYRYPDRPALVENVLAGPEQVFRVNLNRSVANVGAAVVSSAQGVRIEPRLVRDADENHLLGPTALPFVANPYLPAFLSRAPIVAALLPSPGTYALVFDTPSSKAAGQFTFRLWIDDVTPPSARLVSRVAWKGRMIARVADAGSGVDPEGISYRIDGGDPRTGRLDPRRGLAVLDVGGLGRGRHRLLLSVSDRQEAKNNENVPRILPNTRVVETTFRIP